MHTYFGKARARADVFSHKRQGTAKPETGRAAKDCSLQSAFGQSSGVTQNFRRCRAPRRRAGLGLSAGGLRKWVCSPGSDAKADPGRALGLGHRHPKFPNHIELW